MHTPTHPTTWPGHAHGARAPQARETPLSPTEVIVGLQDGTIGAHLTPAQREEAIEALDGDTLLPVVRRALPPGAWAGHTPAHPGMWGGLMGHTASAANDSTTRRHA